MISLLNRRTRGTRRPTKNFRQLYGHLMKGFNHSMGMDVEEHKLQPPIMTIPGPPGPPGPAGQDGVGIDLLKQVDRNLHVFLTNGHGKVLDNIMGLDGKDGAPGSNGKDGTDGKDGKIGLQGHPGSKGLKGDRGLAGLNAADGEDGKDGPPGRIGLRGKLGPRGLLGKQGLPGKIGKQGPAGPPGPVGKTIQTIVNQSKLDVVIEEDFPRNRLRIKIGKNYSNWVTMRRGGGGGLASVSTDATLTGDGGSKSPLSVVGGGGAVDSVFSRTGVIVAAANDYTWAQINKTVSDLADLATKSHISLTDKGTNTHPQIDTHLGSTANPHSVTAAQASADPAGSAATVQGNLNTHEADTANPHSVTAAQASADPAGTASAGDAAHLAAFIHGNIALNTTHRGSDGTDHANVVLADTHRGLTNNPHSVTAAQAGADPTGSAAAVQGNLNTHEADTTNPHSVTAGQAGADPSGSAAAVQSNLSTHEALSDIHIAHSGVTLTAGVGLSGGGDIAANRTFDLADTVVAPGSYTYASLTVDQQGRLTAASSGSAPAVSSVFSRVGAVVAVANDYTWAEIDKTVSDLADLATKSHTSLTDKGTNSHAQIDTHIADTTNPHATDLDNLGSGTLVELNALITDANVDDGGDPRDPNNHASNHTDGTDDIQNATDAQKGLATAAQITMLETHAPRHENAGADEISVAGLSGELADNQPPKNHASNHTDGTDDIQDAGAAQKGLLTSAAQTIGGIKTFNANILPVGSIIFQTGATDLDLATNAARFYPHRVSQAGQPTPASGELMMWYKPTGGRVRIVYNDPAGGVKTVMLG